MMRALTLGGHPVRQALAFLAWITAVAAAFDFGVFTLPVGPWLGNGLQVLGYLLDIAPIVAFAPDIVRTLPAPRLQVLLGAAAVCAAIVYAAARNLYPNTLPENVIGFTATGFCEELCFRGFLWDRLQAAGFRPAVVVVVNVAAFVLWHLVSVASGSNDLGDLVGVLWFGALVSLVRLRCGNTGLPALIHMAFDIAGI